MSRTKRIVVVTPESLLADAREGLDLPKDASITTIVRGALIAATGRTSESYPVLRPGQNFEHHTKKTA